MEMTPLITEAEIAEAVDRLAGRIRRDYAGKTPLFIGCLTGSFVFMADLVRRAAIPCECDFMKLSSYGDQTTAGEIQLLLDHTLPVEGKHVVLVEDIVDTGASLGFIRQRVAARGPAGLASCVLLYKESPRQTLAKGAIEYLGITIPDRFIVGYGIDCAQQYRELPYIAAVKN